MNDGYGEWKTEGWWTSPFNFRPEVRSLLDLPARIAFHDVTLRDGEQTPGVVFRKDDKIRIAELLDEAGVDRIEVAMPAVTEEDADAVEAVSALGPRADVYRLLPGNYRGYRSRCRPWC